jgi:hypothetical protein
LGCLFPIYGKMKTCSKPPTRYTKYKHRAYAENQDRYINQPIYGKIKFIFKPEPIIYVSLPSGND